MKRKDGATRNTAVILSLFGFAGVRDFGDWYVEREIVMGDLDLSVASW